MITYKEFQEALKIVNEYKTQLEADVKEVAKEVNSIGKFANVNAEMAFSKIDCSVRLYNIVKAYFYQFDIAFNTETKISELSEISICKFLECRNAGKVTLLELSELCFYAGVSLKP